MISIIKHKFKSALPLIFPSMNYWGSWCKYCFSQDDYVKTAEENIGSDEGKSEKVIFILYSQVYRADLWYVFSSYSLCAIAVKAHGSVCSIVKEASVIRSISHAKHLKWLRYHSIINALRAFCCYESAPAGETLRFTSSHYQSVYFF